MKNNYKNIGDPFDCLIEECSELIHIICKAKRFGINNHHPNDMNKITNKYRILSEIKDVEYRIIQVKKELGI